MLRFGCVGVIGAALNTALLWLLTEQAHVYYLASSVLATEVAILVNFILNHTWTFATLRDEHGLLSKLVKFNVVSLGGLALTVATLFVLTQFAGLHYMFANILAIGFAATWNYVVNRRWTWCGPVPARVEERLDAAA
jgi:dolichol-phosphate mannosyltransferase